MNNGSRSYPLKSRLSVVRQELGWRKRSLLRRWLGQHAEPNSWEALTAYRGLMQQAWGTKPLAPNILSDLWHNGAFHKPTDHAAFFNPASREREASSHHYGHDIQLKRYAGLPLIGRPLPYLLEHGLKVSRHAQFETPRHWAKGGYLCMGQQRALWLHERFGCRAYAIGPWIQYAQSLLPPADMQQVKQELGRTLLVILAHSWDRVSRSMDTEECVGEVSQIAVRNQYQTVIWLRHWQDPTNLPLPNHWIQACNGHRSNPWFLDALHTLMQLSDGLASNAFGTHIGYAACKDLELHWMNSAAHEDRSLLPSEQEQRARQEWEERARLSEELAHVLNKYSHKPSNNPHLIKLLNPFWGFDQVQSSHSLRKILTFGG